MTNLVFADAAQPLMNLAQSILGQAGTDAAATAANAAAGAAQEAVKNASEQGISWQQYGAVAIALAVLILPFFLGNFLAKSLKMPSYGTRFGWILLAIIASGVVLAKSRPGLGVDLRGGTILVYEMDPGKMNAGGDSEMQQITSEDLVEPLTRRINPSGTQEIVIRPYGESQIEIIVPEVDQREVDRIKGLVEEAGILRFAILANQSDHQPQINFAIEQAGSKDRAARLSEVVRDPGSEDNSIVGLWANVDREKDGETLGALRVDVGDAIVRNPDTGEILTLPAELRGPNGAAAIAAYIDQMGMSGIEALMIIDPLIDITGEDLAFAASTFDEKGSPAVAFNLTDAGSNRFFVLTTNNAPIGQRTRQLGIVLDDNLLSAPSIQSPIRKEGRITGRFTRQEVESLVQILKAGQLPAALTKQPIAENQIDATLGRDTITKGVWAITVSLLLVLLFILVYYRFAGIIACIALVLNLGLILATMVLINQPLTLPGLAGLVLTVGMSVDANVLVFERIREELKKGAAARMSIRNGFAKATVTIIDANLTTLITAIVLYAIGTDQIRGFAVTLILGIVFSMFTAIYVSRTLFDLAERRGFLSLSMSDGVNSLRTAFTGENGVDFMGKGKAALAISAVLVTIGLVSLYARGKSIFDIDFAGGSSVQFRLDTPTPTQKVRDIVKPEMVQANENGTEDVPYTVNGVTMDGIENRTVYKVDSAFATVEELKAAVAKAFAASQEVNMVTYNVSISPADGPSTDDQSMFAPSDANGVMLAVAQAQETAPAIGEAPADDAENLVNSSAVIKLGVEGDEEGGLLNASTLRESLLAAAKAVNVPLAERSVSVKPLGEGADQWKPDSSLTFQDWQVDLPIGAADADKIMESFKTTLDADPVWISSSSVGARVAGDMIGRALGALFASLLCIVGYIWFRFQRVIYGFAAVAALLHDVLITLGAIAISYWLADALGFLLIDPFKISLTVVAAILTIIGYSLNDTIVVFDRIRETKGKAPRLTSDMINSSINQTLSRTLLTSLTTFIVVILLYWFGGDGIHAFAFSLVVGVIAGTYSSVFVASPILLWLVERSERKAAAA
ncbi:bifunctional preprotein translocase subunit SecD/SecF [Rubripirellula lacrimiformis]|uniref:Multifunctional fusion protein n=1 Tax=Rubripirellula lacrimiformis TaxID=1930273 RepID=A0A517NFL0_9BACT|nr:protein translocase subunit SecD [Rubripirellula lacrimiformis]QDT05848.1 bifunctional preprotein translocase subunit SecD/SecF [Rubripirellula lacrimiformis]